MSATAATQDLALVPGALEEQKSRELPDGTLIEFESAPAGWTTKSDRRRERDHRAYYLTVPADDCTPCEGTGRRFDQSVRGRCCALCAGTGSLTRRVRVPSVSTILDAICPKPGLPIWSEARGIEGAIEAVRRGEIPRLGEADAYHQDLDGSKAVDTVRRLKLGADRARDEAADRGLNVHACLEHYMRTGSPPNPADHPEAHRGYLQALTRWLLKAQPERDGAMVEELVASRTRGYAGRVDFRARLADGLLYAIDAKTQERGGIYLAAHAQINLYEDAAVECGDEPADRKLVVVFAANGEFREMPADHPPAFVQAALAWMRHARPIDAQCERQNAIERKARETPRNSESRTSLQSAAQPGHPQPQAEAAA